MLAICSFFDPELFPSLFVTSICRHFFVVMVTHNVLTIPSLKRDSTITVVFNFELLPRAGCTSICSHVTSTALILGDPFFLERFESDSLFACFKSPASAIFVSSLRQLSPELSWNSMFIFRSFGSVNINIATLLQVFGPGRWDLSDFIPVELALSEGLLVDNVVRFARDKEDILAILGPAQVSIISDGS